MISKLSIYLFSRFRWVNDSGSANDDDTNNTSNHPVKVENDDNEDESKLGVDDGNIDDLEEEVDELVHELMGYKGAN